MVTFKLRKLARKSKSAFRPLDRARLQLRNGVHSENIDSLRETVEYLKRIPGNTEHILEMNGILHQARSDISAGLLNRDRSIMYGNQICGLLNKIENR